jgi:hypothetical protein
VTLAASFVSEKVLETVVSGVRESVVESDSLGDQVVDSDSEGESSFETENVRERLLDRDPDRDGTLLIESVDVDDRVPDAVRALENEKL